MLPPRVRGKGLLGSGKMAQAGWKDQQTIPSGDRKNTARKPRRPGRRASCRNGTLCMAILLRESPARRPLWYHSSTYARTPHLQPGPPNLAAAQTRRTHAARRPVLASAKLSHLPAVWSSFLFAVPVGLIVTHAPRLARERATAARRAKAVRS
ncbi:hypothetical protein PG993_002697 [Apiospora rasikravindrae]|uniref:Uncharacterized protein n=1 Tax=Apiospora rasikravindrae TaxID=990691 RepID=A0ABR1TXI6_9PEZI